MALRRLDFGFLAPQPRGRRLLLLLGYLGSVGKAFDAFLPRVQELLSVALLCSGITLPVDLLSSTR